MCTKWCTRHLEYFHFPLSFSNLRLEIWHFGLSISLSIYSLKWNTHTCLCVFNFPLLFFADPCVSLFISNWDECTIIDWPPHCCCSAEWMMAEHKHWETYTHTCHRDLNHVLRSNSSKWIRKQGKSLFVSVIEWGKNTCCIVFYLVCSRVSQP